MKPIPLTKGLCADVDDADFEWLSQWKWCVFGTVDRPYAGRYAGKKLILMHRLINETPDGMVTDHIDCNPLNNSRSNLRTVTQLQNVMNRRGKRGGTSKYKGVWADPNPRNTKLWRSGIRLSGRMKYLGRFHTEEEAAKAYEAAAKTHFGEFARSTPGASK